MFEADSKVLIVEDTEITRAIVKKMVEKLGFRKITEVSNGKDAWLELENSLRQMSPYRLVITDWNMPEMSGLELFQKMQEAPAFRSLAFIMLTSNTDKDQVINAIKAGITFYLAKPFPSSALERKIRDAWDHAYKKKAS